MTTRQIPFDIIVGRSINRGIGINNSLPWKLPSDLKMFKKITTSGTQQNAIIMGRKTFQSMNKKILPHRTNIIVTNSLKIEQNENLKQAGSLKQALQLAQSINKKSKKFVIGGSKLFQQAIENCRYLYQTQINQNIQCDTFFPLHNHKCTFVSKTMFQNNLIFDYRQYLNTNKFPQILDNLQKKQNLFDCQEHQEYQYLKMIKNIIQQGQQKIDRTKTGTRTIFGGMMKYDLRQTFPLLTHKKVFWRGVAQQLLWFIKGSTDSRQLQKKKIHIWDGNSSKQYLKSIGINRQAGDLGPVYGFQWRHWNAPYQNFQTNYNGKGIDQLTNIIHQIKTNPSSRRLILSAWNPSQMKQMALPPCHLLAQFHVTNDNRLSCILYQRSCDMGLGVPFNIASYALLTCLIAQVTGLQRGQLTHMMGDMHVYNDHISSLKELQKIVPYQFPILLIDKNIKDIDSFKYEHFQLKGYRSHKKIQMKMSV